MSKTIEQILLPKPEARPRIYAYSIADTAHTGLLKVGQTTRNVKKRIAEQLKTANIKNYKIELDESAEREDGTIFTDHDVRAALVKKGFENPELEWMRCKLKDVKTVLTELRTGEKFTGTHSQTFAMRREQAEAVDKTFDYFHSIWAENKKSVPRFLWNAKMRFGKTFTAYQLAKKLQAMKHYLKHYLTDKIKLTLSDLQTKLPHEFLPSHPSHRSHDLPCRHPHEPGTVSFRGFGEGADAAHALADSGGLRGGGVDVCGDEQSFACRGPGSGQGGGGCGGGQ